MFRFPLRLVYYLIISYRCMVLCVTLTCPPFLVNSSVLYLYIVLSVTLTPTVHRDPPLPPRLHPTAVKVASAAWKTGTEVPSSKAKETVVGFFTRCLHSNCWRWVSSEDIPRRVSVYSVTKRVSCSLEQSGLLVPVANQGQGPQLSQHWQFFTNSS